MVITVLEAFVNEDQAAVLQETFNEAVRSLDPGIVQTMLLHGVIEPGVWQIVTTWESRAALDAMRASGETPRGVLIFRAAKAEPTLRIFDVAVQKTRVSG